MDEIEKSVHYLAEKRNRKHQKMKLQENKKVQLFGNFEKFRVVVKCCLITQVVGQLSGIFGWFEFGVGNYKEKLNGWKVRYANIIE